MQADPCLWDLWRVLLFRKSVLDKITKPSSSRETFHLDSLEKLSWTFTYRRHLCTRAVSSWDSHLFGTYSNHDPIRGFDGFLVAMCATPHEWRRIWRYGWQRDPATPKPSDRLISSIRPERKNKLLNQYLKVILLSRCGFRSFHDILIH